MKPKRAKPTTVLVVEDEPTIRTLAESIIGALGYMILSAANAREAIALLEQDEPIDTLFTDINLPDGPDAEKAHGLGDCGARLGKRMAISWPLAVTPCPTAGVCAPESRHPHAAPTNGVVRHKLIGSGSLWERNEFGLVAGHLR